MKKMIVANWKANLAPEGAVQRLDAFATVYRPRLDIEVILAVPGLALPTVAAKVEALPGVALAAQSVSAYPQGSYTGSTPASWLRGLATYTLLGHRERRGYFHETVQDVARQIYESLAEDLRPIEVAPIVRTDFYLFKVKTLPVVRLPAQPLVAS